MCGGSWSPRSGRVASGTSRVRNLRRLVSARTGLARNPLSARSGYSDSGIAEPGLERGLQVQNERVIEADRQPGILARMLGSMLQTAREIAGLSYDQAAARLGCETDWLVRVETGFAVAPPEQVARILIEYGVREARVADTIIDMAQRVAAPPPWLAPHASRMSAADRDVLLVEAEATLAQVHGFLLIPYLVQTEGYFREIAPGVFHGCDVDQEWDLLSCRQAHRPAGVTRLLEVIIDESAFELRLKRPEVMAGQLRHLLALADSPHATVRVIPRDAAFWESRGHNFDVLVLRGHHRPDRRQLLPGPRRRTHLRRSLRPVDSHREHLGCRPDSEPGHPRTAPDCPQLNHAMSTPHSTQVAAARAAAACGPGPAGR